MRFAFFALAIYLLPTYGFALDRKLSELTAAIRVAIAHLDKDENMADGEKANRLWTSLNELANTVHTGLTEVRRSTLGDLQRIDVERNRAASWLEGWRVFSALAAAASQPGNESLRKPLLVDGKQKPSVLGLLIEIFSQMHDDTYVFRQATANWNSTDPLRLRLSRPEGLLTNWPRIKPDPNQTPHGFWIPSADDLIGKPHAPPELDAKTKALTLWGLVNWQLDTWHKPSGGQEQILRLDPVYVAKLNDWIKQLAADENLAKWGPLSLSFQARATKLARFLDFRQRIADNNQLAKCLEEVAKARLLNDATAFRAEKCLGDLIEAATPFQNSTERLHDAHAWLAYIILLSHQNDSEKVPSISTDWELRWRLPGKFPPHLPPAMKLNNKDGRVPFLRWNQSPVAGHLTHLLAHTVHATHVYRKFERTTRNPGQGAQARAQRLGQELKELRAALKTDVDPYFAQNTPLNAAELRFDENGNLAGWRELRQHLARHATPHEPPMALGHALGDYSRPWRLTTNSSEAARFEKDLADLAALLSSSERLHSLIHRAYESKDPAVISQALKSVTGFSTSPHWNVHALPRKSFMQYYVEAKNKAERLKTLAKGMAQKAEIESELRHRYLQQLTSYNQAHTELAVARLGREIADKALEVSELFRRIAEIDVEIAALRTKAAKALESARSNKQQSSALRLVYAARQRDLAEARLQALIAASEHAQEIVKKATVDLEILKQQLLDTAKKIEDQKKKSGIFGFIRAVINVVGAALAPFTGGASLAGAQLANMSVDIVQTIDDTDWTNFATAAKGIGRIAKQAGRAIEFGVEEFGDKDMKIALGEYKAFLKSAEKDIGEFVEKGKDVYKQAQDVFEQGKRLHEAVKKLAKNNKQQAAAFAAAVAGGAPIRYEKGRLNVDLNQARKLIIEDKELKSALRDVLHAGGAVFNDVQFRQQDLAELLQLRELKEQKSQLTKYLEQVVRHLPQEVVQEIAGDFNQAKDRFGEAKARLLRRVDDMKADGIRTMAQVLGGGMVVVEINGEVVAMERKIVEETKQFQRRLKDFREAVAGEAIKATINNIEAERKGIVELANKFAKEEKEDALRDVAHKKVPHAIDAIRAQLRNFEQQISEARGKLQDSEDLKRIAHYDSLAAGHLLKEANLRVAIAGQEARRAALRIDMVRAALERDQLNVRRSDLKIDAEVLAIQIAEAELQHLYLKCLAQGFDPRDDHVSPARLIGLHNVLVVTSQRGANAEMRYLLDGAVENVVGMLQWLRALGLKGNYARKHAQRQISLAELLAIASDASDRPARCIDDLERLATAARDLYVKHAKDKLVVEVTQKPGYGAAAPENGAIRWLTPSAKQVDPWLRRLSNDAMRVQAIGVMDLGFFTAPPRPLENVNEPEHKTPIDRPGAAQRASYYMLPSRSKLVYHNDHFQNSGHLRFVIVAPNNAVAHHQRSVASANSMKEFGDGRRADFKINVDADILGPLRKDLQIVQGLDLTGAIGYWRVYLFHTSIDNRNDQERVVSKFKRELADAKKNNLNARPLTFDLYIPYLRFRSY